MLSELQQRLARIVAQLPQADEFALAGGAALVLANIVDRETRDLDYFGPSAGAVDALAEAVETALMTAGLDVRRERGGHGFVRFIVTDGRDATALDIGADARIRPAQPGSLGSPCTSCPEAASRSNCAW